jgi:hypothetical protein
MGIFRDKTGIVFGRLTVRLFVGFDQNRHSLWRCACTCGNSTVATSCNLVSGEVQSCGCGETESRYLNATHGHTRDNVDTPEYRSWTAMNTRCTNSKRTEWERYGGRGITVCERWQSFEAFFEDMGPRPKGKSLDRFPNNDGNYEPGNCRWATQREQTANTRRNKFLTIDGQTFCVTEWARRAGLGEATLRGRLRRGWETDKLLSAVQPHLSEQIRKPPQAVPARDTEPAKRMA